MRLRLGRLTVVARAKRLGGGWRDHTLSVVWRSGLHRNWYLPDDEIDEYQAYLEDRVRRTDTLPQEVA